MFGFVLSWAFFSSWWRYLNLSIAQSLKNTKCEHISETDPGFHQVKENDNS